MKRKRKITILASFILSGLILSPPGAQAALITIQIEAVVDSVWDDGNYLEGKVQIGDIITGFYVYESTTRDSTPEYPTVGRYEHSAPPAGIYLTVGGFEFSTDALNVDFLVGIADNATSDGLHDSYWIHSYNNMPLSNGSPVDDIFWDLRDNVALAVSTISLPPTAPVLNDWQSRNILGIGADRRYGISAHVNSAIPEPCTIVLLGLAGLALRKRS